MDFYGPKTIQNYIIWKWDLYVLFLGALKKVTYMSVYVPIRNISWGGVVPSSIQGGVSYAN